MYLSFGSLIFLQSVYFTSRNLFVTPFIYWFQVWYFEIDGFYKAMFHFVMAAVFFSSYFTGNRWWTKADILKRKVVMIGACRPGSKVENNDRYSVASLHFLNGLCFVLKIPWEINSRHHSSNSLKNALVNNSFLNGWKTHVGPCEVRRNPSLQSGSTKCSTLHALCFCSRSYKGNCQSQSLPL